jgi:hypothetical protein
MPPSEARRLVHLSPAERLAAQPAAAVWARSCAWVPGTGHCRQRDCSPACIFRPQREAEAVRVQRWRRLRRALSRWSGGR